MKSHEAIIVIWGLCWMFSIAIIYFYIDYEAIGGIFMTINTILMMVGVVLINKEVVMKAKEKAMNVIEELAIYYSKFDMTYEEHRNY